MHHTSVRRLPQMAALFVLLLSAPSVWGQNDPTTEELVEKLKEAEQAEKTEDGWTWLLKLGATFNLTDSRNVVGSEEGTAVQLGILLDTSAKLRSGPHRWDNRLNLQHNQSLTPPLESFVKSFDLLTFDTLYIYMLSKPEWIGIFANANLQTAILDGFVVRATPVDVVVDGVARRVPAETRIPLTSAFEPLQLRQSVGLYADPIQEQTISVEASLGAAAQQTLTQDGFRLDGDADGVLTLVRLGDLSEFGAELEVKGSGTLIPEEVLKWSLSANLFLPVVDSNDGDRDFADRLNLRVDGGLALKLTKVLTAEYALTLLRQPQILEDLQVQNTFLLALNVDII